MTDDIVTRLREHHGDFRVAVGVNQAFVLETIYSEAANEIERLRTELQHSALQTNVMRNIATAPYGEASEQITDLAAELAECRSEYQKLWRKYNRAMRGE